MSRTLVTPIVCRSDAYPATPPHPTLVASLAMSVGDLTMVSPSPSQPTVVHQVTTVLGELAPQVKEVLVLWM
jgi:hypothetical protein